MGLLSFAAIAVPMSVILLNAFIGDAIIDVILPGIYAGVLIAGAELYAVSSLALLLPICVAVVALCYFVFVYRPASDTHSHRKQELNRMRYGDSWYLFRSNRHNTTTWSATSCIKPVGTIAKRSIQDSITWMSCGEVRLRDPKKRIVQRDWCYLNMAPASQGAILSASNNGTRCHSFTSRHQLHAVFLPPKRISDMMTSSTQWKSLYLNKMGSTTEEEEDGLQTTPKGLSSDSKNDSSLDKAHTAIDAPDQLVVTKQGSKDLQLKRVTPAIVFDPIEVLFRMRSRLAASSNRTPLSGFDEVDAESLFEEYAYALQSFYPDGIPLSAEETEEAFDMFSLWKSSTYLHTRYEEDGEEGRQMVLFHAFEEWFLNDLISVFRNSLLERLVSHTLRCVPIVRKRIMRATSSSSSWHSDSRLPLSPSLSPSQTQSSSRRTSIKDEPSTRSPNLLFESIYSSTDSETHENNRSIEAYDETDRTPSPPTQTRIPFSGETPSHWLQSSYNPKHWVESSEMELFNEEKIEKNYTNDDMKDENKNEYRRSRKIDRY